MTLAGPAIILIAFHSGSSLDYLHQCTAAEGVVHATRRRQLAKQTEIRNHLFKTEVPQGAPAAVSREFRLSLDQNPAAIHATLDLGSLLSGYMMCVLDRLVRGLRSEVWLDFASANAFIEDIDRWYWIYCDASMRSLGMTEPADQLQYFCQEICWEPRCC